MDISIERSGTINPNSFDGSSIYEWNIDSLSEFQIIQTTQKMVMYSNILKANNNTEKQVFELIFSDFTGQ